ncbi:MAG: FeS assembly protein SufB [candidate division TM6 bacterium GW2011_GWE2_41_16]|nr:MAG: FeS assembly protein SufB [candidate division TM6 bacterium GW2011_GWE2_41_16]
MAYNDLVVRSGLTPDFVRDLSTRKGEPIWMRERRLAAFDFFAHAQLPKLPVPYDQIPFERIRYYVELSLAERSGVNLDDYTKNYYGAYSIQLDSTVLFEQLHQDLAARGILFCSLDAAVQQHAQLVETYFESVVSHTNDPFAALNTALWSGGIFLYVPAGQIVDQPLSAYYATSTPNVGQFERMLCILEKGSRVEIREGCGSMGCIDDAKGILHSGVAEIMQKEDSSLSFTTMQRWHDQMILLATKKARLEKRARLNWCDANKGCHVIKKMPTIELVGAGASGKIVSFVVSGSNHVHDTGGRCVHRAPETISSIVSRALVLNSATAIVRAATICERGAHNAQGYIRCDTLLQGKNASVSSYPQVETHEQTAKLSHEAAVRSIDQESMFFLMSRGLSESQAQEMLMRGFIEPIIQQFPSDFAIELEEFFSDSCIAYAGSDTLNF